MKRAAVIFMVVGIVSLVVQFEIFARGGGGGGRGGGGGGGGGSRGGGGGGGGFSPSAGRAPAPQARPSGGAARPSTAKASPAAGARPSTAKASPAAGARPSTAKAGAGAAGGAKVASGARPSAGQLNNFLDVPGGGGAGVAAAGGAARGSGAAADFLQQGAGASQLPAAGAAGRAAGAGAATAAGRAAGVGAAAGVAAGVGRPGTAGQNLAQNQPGRIENRGERQETRNTRRDEIQNQYQQNNPGNFWQENPGWSAWAITRPFAWANWGSVGSWCGYGEEATSYSYGEDVYYADDQVYMGDQPVATTEEYAEQAETIATTEPAAAPQQGDWLPLGVFAITQDGQASGAAPSLYMQLAISKQGAISGTLKNTLSGKVDSLEGMADKKSQRVAWTVEGQQRPIMETGLSNLTQDTGPALIHFADGQTQQWLMVRMPEQGSPAKP